MCNEPSEGEELRMDALCNETPQEKQKPTIAELEKLIGTPNQPDILPDGTLRERVAPMPKYEPKTIDDCLSHLTSHMSFEELIIWADALEVDHDQECWADDEWTNLEDKLRGEVGEVLGVLIDCHI